MIKELCFFAAGGIATAYYMDELDKKNNGGVGRTTSKYAQTTVYEKRHAFVKNLKGANLYVQVGYRKVPIHGFGVSKITNLAYKTYVGELTGQKKQGYSQVEIKINSMLIHAWIETDKIQIVKEGEYHAIKHLFILEKSDKNKSEIVKRIKF